MIYRSIMTALWKTQQAAERVRCRYLHPTNRQKQLTPVFELEKAERFWGEGPSYRRNSSLILDPRDLSNTGPPTDSIHQLIWGTQHTYNRGLPGLCSFRDDAPNPQETGGPREFRGQVGWGMGHPRGDRVGREEVWDVEQSEGGWGGAGNGIWSVKNELQIKLN